MSDEPLTAQLQELVERDLAAWPDMPARLLHVWAPDRQVDVEVAAGVADVATGEPLMPGARFRVASITKSFLAAAVLRLVEQDRLGLDDPLDGLLPSEYLAVLRGGGYDPGSITLRHLLTHTSGIYDFAASAYDPSIPDNYDQAIAKDPQHRWTRMEQIEFAMEHGEPYGAAGAFFGYSDTNACLVGEILEQRTGLTMGAAIRGLVDYDGLGLQSTWLESIEPEPADPPQLSHQYEGEVDVAGIDPSVDLYGGGGLMSTCRDLARFYRALLRGEIFEHGSTLATMTTTLSGIPPTPETGLDDDPSTAAMYLFQAEIGGHVWWGHDGWWGTTAYTCPVQDVTIVAGHQQALMPKTFGRPQMLAQAFELLTNT